MRLRHGHQVRSVAFAPDGKTLAMGGDGGGTVYLWESAAGRERRRFPGPAHAVEALAFARGGKLPASAG
jgi:WD40 repeat protein